MTTSPHVLTPHEAPGDVVETLEQLLDGARGGHVVGLALSVVLRRRRYMTIVSGECHRDPTYARGTVAVLDDELSAMISARAQESTQ